MTSSVTPALSQNINMTILVNEKLVVEELSRVHLTFDSLTNRQIFYIAYVPGELVFDSESWNKIRSYTSSRLFLQFDYDTYRKHNHEIGNFFVELTRSELRQRYLILHIYDFRDKKFKHWYHSNTDKDFLAEFESPGSGRYMRNK